VVDSSYNLGECGTYLDIFAPRHKKEEYAMRIAKKLLAMTVVLAMVMGLTSATMFANSDIRVVVDGVEVNFVDQGPIMEDSRILAPVRGVFTHMGFVPSWNSDTSVATLTGDGVTVVIPVGNMHFYVNGERVNTDIASRLLNDRVMLPLGAIATAVGATAAWDGATSTATITTAAYEPTPEPGDEDYDTDEDANDENEVADYAFLGTWFTVDERRWIFRDDGSGRDDWGDVFTWVVVDGEYLILSYPYANYDTVFHFEGGDGNVLTLRYIEGGEGFFVFMTYGDSIMLVRDFAS